MMVGVMNKKTLLLSALVLAAFIVLIRLGNWQVRRLAWKTALIEKIHQRLKQPPVSLENIAKRFAAGENLDYVPVRLRGRFLHEYERHLYHQNEKGRPGWYIYTLFQTGREEDHSKRLVIVNRGFVPVELKKAETRLEGLIRGEIEVVGLIRSPQKKKYLTDPPNNPGKNEYFWPSFKDMVGHVDMLASRQTGFHLLPLFVDLISPTPPGGWPRPGVTRINLPNNHLGYLITWYGLALALLAVYGFFLYGQWKKPAEQ